MKSLAPAQVVEALHWRYATQKFDPTKKIPDETWSALEEALVKVGDKVKTKQNIGKVSTDQQEGTTELHFEVWKSGGIKLDPEAWIAK